MKSNVNYLVTMFLLCACSTLTYAKIEKVDLIELINNSKTEASLTFNHADFCEISHRTCNDADDQDCVYAVAITQPEYKSIRIFAGDPLVITAMSKRDIKILYRGEQLPKKVTWCLTYAYGHDVETYTSSSILFTDYLKPDLWSLRHNTSQPIELGKTGQLLDANGEWIRNEYAYPWWGTKTLTIKPHKN